MTNRRLLDALGLAVGTDEEVENGQNVTAIFDDAGEDVAESRFTLSIAVPFGENCWGYLNVPT